MFILTPWKTTISCLNRKVYNFVYVVVVDALLVSVRFDTKQETNNEYKIYEAK